MKERKRVHYFMKHRVQCISLSEIVSTSPNKQSQITRSWCKKQYVAFITIARGWFAPSEKQKGKFCWGCR